MKNKLKFILILALSVALIGCAFQKNIGNDVAPKEQLNNEKSEEKTSEEEPSGKPEDESAKDNNSGDAKEKKQEEPVGENNEKSNDGSDKKSNKDAEDNNAVSNNKKKVIYLTFDDGPSNNVTDNVLDVLKENKVKGTFFLIGNQIKGREKTVKRIYDEGNSIGLHSFSHNYKKIYNNEDEFIKEMIECRNEINRVVGISPNIIRFPGGSYKHLSKNFLKRLHNKHFKIYDWNLENSDGLKSETSPEELYEKATRGHEQKERAILLLHCADKHQNTCKALPKIIKYYKSQGYEFKTITEETKELYPPLKK